MAKTETKPTIASKLEKVNDNFSVHMYDNGYMFEISGRNSNDDWASAKIIVSDVSELTGLILEASTLPRD
jgi:hypothetical protein